VTLQTSVHEERYEDARAIASALHLAGIAAACTALIQTGDQRLVAWLSQQVARMDPAAEIMSTEDTLATIEKHLKNSN
jgi:hypothetical protein